MTDKGSLRVLDLDMSCRAIDDNNDDDDDDDDDDELQGLQNTWSLENKAHC